MQVAKALTICLAAALSGAAAQPALLGGHHGLAHHGLAHHGLAHHGLAHHGLAHHGLAHHAVGGQTSHQAVTTAHGEQRSLVQSKALGATHSSVSQADNSKGLIEVQPSLGANHVVPVGHAAVVPVATHAVHSAPALAHHAVVHGVHPIAHAVHGAPVVHSSPSYIAPAPTAAPSYIAPAPASLYKAPAKQMVKPAPSYLAPTPTVASLYAAPAKAIVKTAPSYIAPAHVLVANPAPTYLAPAKKMPAPAYLAPAPAYHAPAPAAYHAPAPAYHAPAPASYHPYSYTYAVADDYSKATFSQKESNDGTGLVQGSYSVNLPDGRIQTVNYHANDIDGYVAEVSYSGEAVYPDTPASHPVSHAVAPAYHAPAPAYHAPAPAYHAPVPAITHHVVAHPIAHPIAHAIAHPMAHATAHPIAHATAAHVVSHPAVSHSVVAKDPMPAKPAKEENGDGAMAETEEDSA